MKNLKEQFRECPTCLGVGKVKVISLFGHYTPEVRKKARELYRQGLTLRKIGEIIGVNHPQKVMSLIKSKL